MLQLNPQTKLPIVRQLNNPADVSGYYVQAVVRNSLLKTVIGTINLTDDGEGRFTGTYLVPSTEGFYFDITTYVFTDAGYSVASETYGSENEPYLGATRWGLQYWNGAGGGDAISYKKVGEALEKVLSKYSFITKEDVSDVVSVAQRTLKMAIDGVEKSVMEIDIPEVKIPKQEKVDFNPVFERIDGLKPSLSEIKDNTEASLINEEILMQQVNGVNENVTVSKEAVLTKQEEKGQSEKILETERDSYKEQLVKIRTAMGDLSSEYPEMKPEQEKKGKEDMGLRVKKFMRI